MEQADFFVRGVGASNLLTAQICSRLPCDMPCTAVTCVARMTWTVHGMMLGLQISLTAVVCFEPSHP